MVKGWKEATGELKHGSFYDWVIAPDKGGNVNSPGYHIVQLEV